MHSLHAQQGDGQKELDTVAILNSDQSIKYRTAAEPSQICVPAGKYLKRLLKEVLTSKDQLDQEIRDIIEQNLIPWRDEILGNE